MQFDNVKARVFAGAAFLDAVFGTKWAKKIDPERLALRDGEACILGQVFGDYGQGIYELGIAAVRTRTTLGKDCLASARTRMQA